MTHTIGIYIKLGKRVMMVVIEGERFSTKDCVPTIPKYFMSQAMRLNVINTYLIEPMK